MVLKVSYRNSLHTIIVGSKQIILMKFIVHWGRTRDRMSVLVICFKISQTEQEKGSGKVK